MDIPKTFNESFERAGQLAERFAANESVYLSQKYQEAEVRQEFLDLFWESLGWDVYHKEHPNPYEREVRIEKSVMVGDRGKRADYAFFITPNFLQACFLAEAKKPARNLENPYDCFQAIRYGWNSNTPIAVLTDFEQFLVLDSRYKPDVKSAMARILTRFSYGDYRDEERFRELYYLFSREAVGDGSLEKYVQSLKKARAPKKAAPAVVQVQPVGETFLSELDEHRERLARSFKRCNEHLGGDELTEITQRTLDRLVFIRFLEDKLVEPSEIIERLGKKSGSAWRDFAAEMPRLNKIYNGIIFKPHDILDSPDFIADDKTFGETLNWVSYKDSSYDFNSIPIHILGSIYERFLGKTITVTDKRAKVEEKPEVRKAGGVYYTPEYIVRYIVENTIGKLIEGRAPDEIAEMRFADIACGSGSFLLGIFDYLIKYHVDWYSGVSSPHVSKGSSSPPGALTHVRATDTKRRKADAIKQGHCRETADGNLQLTLEHKRDILLNNIYGVDLDPQAVEVAQLSLYLRLLEEETAASVQPKLGGLREQLLPNLNKNIVHGNSLIDYDIMDGQLFDAKDLKKLSPMNFEDTFPDVFKNGGFDAIVGNPPYGMITDEYQKEYFLEKFVTPEGRFDNYELFVEKALALCKRNGILGYIIPSPVLTNLYTRQLRKFLLENTSILQIVHFGTDVFADPTVHTCIIILGRGSADSSKVFIRKKVASPNELDLDFDYQIDQESLGGNVNFSFDIFIDPRASEILNKIQEKSKPLSEILFVRQCIKTGNDALYVFKSDACPGPEWKPSLRGKSISRYFTEETDLWLKYGDWLARNWKNKSFYETPKIAIRETGSRVTATLDLEHRYFLSSLYAAYPKSKDERHSLNYFLAILNSNLAMYFLRIIALDITAGAFIYRYLVARNDSHKL